MVSQAVTPLIENIANPSNSIIAADIKEKIYFSPCKKNKENYIKPIADIVNIGYFTNITEYNFSSLNLYLKIELIDGRTGQALRTINKTTTGNDNVKGAVDRYFKGLNGHNEKDEEYKILDSDFPDNEYILRYSCYLAYDGGFGGAGRYEFTITYNISVTSVTAPLPKWNAYTVLEKVLNVVEPLREGESPRFKIDPSQKAWLESIETPEFQFTNSTLREVLQSVGSYIHAEPRLIKSGNDLVITYDKYGGSDYSEFTQTYKNYASKSHSINIESFATNLDSAVDNFVNSFDNSAGGSISEPFLNGFKSVLAENSYARITDENMYISTNYPIREIKKVTCFYDDTTVDLTPYIFEVNEYRQLSSYSSVYPHSKNYALYYTIGQKGIYGLNFKADAILNEFNKYAVINILNALGLELNTDGNFAYAELSFNTEYVPIYPARVQQNKSLIESGKEWTKPYNQGQNQIETKYYGEHLKGVIARLGNIDKTITYVIPYYPTVLPKVGELYDDNYYISDTAIEIQPFYTKLTLALSKDFNRYSEYVGVNSVKRMYEISEQQAFNSEISYREFCVFGYDVQGSKNVMLQDYEKNISSAFNWGVDSERLVGVFVQGVGYSDENLDKLFLPIISSSIGNAVLVNFKYEDNYSAGTYAQFVNINEPGVIISKGFYTQTAPYSDVYGRIKYLNIDFISKPQLNSEIEKDNIWLTLPNNNSDLIKNGNSVISTKNLPILVEKGNTEILSFNYQLEFVSKDKDLIIGSALAKNLNFIKTEKRNSQLFLLKDRLNKFNKIIDFTGSEEDKVIAVASGTNLVNGNKFYNYVSEFDGCVAWAIGLPIGNGKYELMLGKNMPIDKGTEIFQGLKFAIVSEQDLYKGE